MYSTKTAAEAKSYVQRQRGISTSDEQIKDALNEFYILYYDAIRQSDSQRLWRSVNIDIAGGYDITQISDLGDDYFELYEISSTETTESVRLPELQPESNQKGFYIQGTTIYPTTALKETNVKVYYEKNVSEITNETALADHTLDVIKRAEYVLFKFLLEKFYDGKYQFQLKQEIKQEFINSLMALFNKPARGFFLPTKQYF